MKEFLNSLSYGISSHEVSNEFKQILRELLTNHIIKEHKTNTILTMVLPLEYLIFQTKAQVFYNALMKVSKKIF